MKVLLAWETLKIFLLTGISKTNIICRKKKKNVVIISNIDGKFISSNLKHKLKKKKKKDLEIYIYIKIKINLKHRPSGQMLSISQFFRVCVRVSVCLFTFEVPFKRLFAHTS